MSSFCDLFGVNFTELNITLPPECNISGYNPWLGYAPSVPANYVVLSMFAVLTIIVTFLTIWKHTWFLIPVTIGGCMEVIGYAARIPSATGGQPVFIVSQFGIILAPTVYAMASYATMSVMMKNLHIKHPICTPFIVRWAFLAGDIASLFVQAAGGGLSVSDDAETSRIGTILLLTGLCMVLSVFVLFMFLTFYMHTRYIRMGKEVTKELLAPLTANMMYTVLYCDMVLLIIRSVYRVVEFSQLEYHNPISTNEALFYGLDALPILLFHFLWIPFHPGLWGLKAPKKKKKDKKDDKEVAMEGNVPS